MFVCKYCGKRCSSPQQLGGHVRRNHSEEAGGDPAGGTRGYHACPDCGYLYPYSTTLEVWTRVGCPWCYCDYDVGTGEIFKPALHKRSEAERQMISPQFIRKTKV